MNGYYQVPTSITFQLKGRVAQDLIEREVMPLLLEQTDARSYGRQGVDFVGYAHGGAPGENITKFFLDLHLDGMEQAQGTPNLTLRLSRMCRVVDATAIRDKLEGIAETSSP